MNETRRTSPADSATAIAQWKAAAIEAQMRGDLSKVESCCRAILEDDPENADALHLLGISAASRGDLAGGIGLVTRAIANSAEPAGYCISLGGMLRQQGNHAAAAAAFARAATLREGFALAECEQGVSLLDDGRHGEALAPLARALQNDPDLARAHYFLAVAAAEAGRNAALADATESILPAGGPDATMISVIICSIDDAKFERVSRNYATLLAGTPYEIIRIPDARSLCEGYNRGVRQSRGDLLVFSHDDIEILTTDFAARLRSHLANYDMIGVVGASLVSGSTWISAGWPHCHG
jgi:tetratricopeptide (TPR) repeat protein